MGSTLQIGGLVALILAASFTSWTAALAAAALAAIYVGIAMER